MKPDALLPILITPHAALRRKARPVGPGDDATIRALVPRMLATMYAAPGIGLAAPQVDVDLRLVVIDIVPNETPNPLALVNPHVVAASADRATREEGCLSVPGQYADISRPAQITLRYHDIDGVRHDLEAEGLLAACLQHEVDHLDGVLFVDYLTPLKRNMLLRRLAKDLKQKAAG